MDKILEKTKNLIDVLESSELIKNLDYYKEKVLLDHDTIALIKRYHEADLDSEKLYLKEKIYENPNYQNYMKYYNELFYYILKINKNFKSYTSERGCF